MTDNFDLDKELKALELELTKPLDPNIDYTPIYQGNVYVGTHQDLLDGKLDLTDQDMWKL